MNETQNIPQCRVTSNYSIFSFLDGNRSIKDGRVAKIKRSIEMVGYIPSPIVVNEKFQIIDGQGRFAALKELGLPVCYIVIPGLSVEHCVAMNINQTNWTLTDYIESYAAQGNENYLRFLSLYEKHPSINVIPAATIATGNVAQVDQTAVRSGRFTVTAERLKTADKILTWVEKNLVDLKGKVKGRFDYLVLASAFCLEHTDANQDRLATAIRENVYDIMPLASVAFAVKEIERVYNKRLSCKKIYFLTEYDKYVTNHATAYNARWKANRKNVPF